MRKGVRDVVRARELFLITGPEIIMMRDITCRIRRSLAWEGESSSEFSYEVYLRAEKQKSLDVKQRVNYPKETSLHIE